MQNSADRLPPVRSSRPQPRPSGVITATLSLLAVVAIHAPQPVHGQSAGYYTQNGVTFWYGGQQQPYGQQNRGYQPQAYANSPAAGYYGAPGYFQPPTASQPALQGNYAPGQYQAAANAAAANRYGGTTAWTRPGFVAPPYQNNSAYAASPQHAHGQHPAAQTYPYGYGQPYAAYGYGYPNQGYAAPGQPAPGQIVAGQIPPGQPGSGQPGSGQPGSGQPGSGQPGSGQPGSGQPGQQPQQPANPQQNQHSQHQLTPTQQAAQQAAANILPNGVPVLSPAAARFFQNLKGPNLSTYNQSRQNYSFSGQTRPSTQIPNTTWQYGSRFGQTNSNFSNYNQTTINQNRFNYSLHNLTDPGLRGY